MMPSDLPSGLNYNNNSCYIDSVLMPLLSVKSDFVKTNILEKKIEKKLNEKYTEIQKELYFLSFYLQKGYQNLSSKNLRLLLLEKFVGCNMEDAGEFLLYIFDIFKVEDVIRRKRTYVIDNDENIILISDVKHNSSPIISIHSSFLKKERVHLSDVIKNFEETFLDKNNLYFYRGNYYSHLISYEFFVKAKYLVFYANRLYVENGREKRSYTEIIPSEEIKIGNDILKIFAIVMHENSHYFCYLKINGEWYYYNDNPGGQKYVLKKVNSLNFFRNGILFFYQIEI